MNIYEIDATVSVAISFWIPFPFDWKQCRNRLN